MNKIAVMQLDGRIPNYAIMKITGYHLSIGDCVEIYKGDIFNDYDKVYFSKIFSTTESPIIPNNAIIGGTGIDYFNRLPEEIENHQPSYLLYPTCNYHLGFAMRGCRLRCEFCCVPKKEGMAKSVSSIKNLLLNPYGGNRLMLLDNDFFGNPLWRDCIREIINLKLKVCFAQGLNIRTITNEQAEYLSLCDFRASNFSSKYISFAWDNINDERTIMRGISRLKNVGIYEKNMQFYCLVGFDSSQKEDLYRINTLKKIGAKVYVMPFDKTNQYQKDLQRYVNNRLIFNSSKTFNEYKRTYVSPTTKQLKLL